jgi:(p)ppGpp synthase/HD superfamily hydrolase
MPLFDLTEFFKLSSALNYNLSAASALNYNLSAASLNRYNVLMYITESKRLDDDDKTDREKKGIVMEALGYLFSAYSQKRRRLGPMAVLHPLRAAALFSRIRPSLDLVELITVLFHDILEDIKPGQFDVQGWKTMEEQLYGLFDRMAPEAESRLTENMLSLTRLANESYYQYIARLLENAPKAPEIVEVKLADRLDNTLDLRIDLEDPLARIDFFETIFQIMFVDNYKGYKPKMEHSPATAINGAKV